MHIYACPQIINNTLYLYSQMHLHTFLCIELCLLGKSILPHNHCYSLYLQLYRMPGDTLAHTVDTPSLMYS